MTLSDVPTVNIFVQNMKIETSNFRPLVHFEDKGFGVDKFAVEVFRLLPLMTRVVCIWNFSGDTDVELENETPQPMGGILAEIWNEVVLDKFPVVSECVENVARLLNTMRDGSLLIVAHYC